MSTTRYRWKDRDLIPRMQGNLARGPMGHRLVVDEHVDEPPEPSLVVEDSIREPRVASIHFIDRFGQVVCAEVDGRDASREFSKRVWHVDLNLGASLRNVTRLLQGPTLSCAADGRGYITFQWRKPVCSKARRNRARRSWTICATMLKAISSGVSADKSSPAGLTMRARAGWSSPAFDRVARTAAARRRLATRPTYIAWDPASSSNALPSYFPIVATTA